MVTQSIFGNTNDTSTSITNDLTIKNMISTPHKMEGSSLHNTRETTLDGTSSSWTTAEDLSTQSKSFNKITTSFYNTQPSNLTSLQQSRTWSETIFTNIFESTTVSPFVTGVTQDLSPFVTNVTQEYSQYVTSSSPIFVESGKLLFQVNHDIFVKHLLPSMIYVSILLAMGIPGNTLILYVYGKLWNKTTSRIFILALAAFDLFNSLCSISIEIFILVRFLIFDIPTLCKVSRFITCILNNGSTFILVVIAYDRFRRICQPLRVPFNPKIAKKIVMYSVIFGFLTGWPALFLYGTFSVPIPIPQTNYVVVGKTCLIDDAMTSKIYPLLWIMFLLLSHFSVDITLVVLYTCVGRAVFKRRSKLKTLKGSYKKADASTTYNSSDTIEVLDAPSPKKKNMKNMSFIFFRDRNSVQMKNNGFAEGRRSSKIKDLAIPLEKKLKTRNIRAGRTTVMLFLVTVVFIVSYIPHTTIVILRSLRGKEFYIGLSDTGKVVYQLLLRSYFLNCVLNPVVYCFVNKQFRKECKNVFSKIFCSCGADE